MTRYYENLYSIAGCCGTRFAQTVLALFPSTVRAIRSVFDSADSLRNYLCMLDILTPQTLRASSSLSKAEHLKYSLTTQTVISKIKHHLYIIMYLSTKGSKGQEIMIHTPHLFSHEREYFLLLNNIFSQFRNLVSHF